MKVTITSFIFLMLLITGCAKQPVHSNAEPSWIINPNQDGKNGAIGVAGRTYDQKVSTQRKLAITRALDELSLQKGVTVNLNVTKQDQVTNNSASMKMDSKGSYNTNNKITAHIEKVWKNRSSGELYIWMVMD